MQDFTWSFDPALGGKNVEHIGCRRGRQNKKEIYLSAVHPNPAEAGYGMTKNSF